MQKFWLLTLLAILLLAACAPAQATPPAAPVASGETTASLAQPTPSQPVSLPTLLPSPTPRPVTLAPENFLEWAVDKPYQSDITRGIEFLDPSYFYNEIAVSPDGRYIAVGGCTENTYNTCRDEFSLGTSFIFILDSQSGEIISEVPEPDATVSGLVFTPDSRQLIYVLRPLKIGVWDIESGNLARVLAQDERGGYYAQIGLSPDGQWLAVVHSGRLRIYDLQSGEQQEKLDALVYSYGFPKFSADGSRLAVYTRKYGAEVTVFETDTWQPAARITLDASGQSSLLFLADLSPDGRWLVTASSAEQAPVTVWDVDSGQAVQTLEEAYSRIRALAFTPDGKMLLVAGSFDEGMSAWDWQSRQKIGVMPVFGEISGVFFAPDLRNFYTANRNQDLHRWSLDGAEINTARQTVEVFFAALARQDYQTAAEGFALSEYDLPQAQAWGLEQDLPGYLEKLCQDEKRLCLPVRRVLPGGGQMWEAESVVFVEFENPDGTLYVMPDYGSTFYLLLQSGPDGKPRVNFIPTE